MTSYQQFQAVFGPDDSDLRRAVFQAFLGEGVAGKGGAGAVQVCRMGASGTIASSTRTLQNTAGTPANAVTLTAKNPGSRGNSLSVTVRAGVIGGQSQLLIFLGGTLVELYNYTSASLAPLVAQINAVSSYVTATLVLDGTALALVSSVALTGGLDGSMLAGADYSAAFNALSKVPFRVVAFANLTDPTIVASAQAWEQTLNTTGYRCSLVLGGLIAESNTTSQTAASSLNDHNIVRLGQGTITDFNLVPGSPTNISTAQGAPRVAGVIASRGERRDLIMARFAGWQLNADSATSADIAAAPTFGLTVLSADGRQDAPVRIAQGCTTFITPTSATDQRSPLLYGGVNIYGSVKYVAVMQGFEMDLLTVQEQTDGNIGDLDVNDQSRAYLIGEGRKLADMRVANGAIQPKPTVVLDTTTFGPPNDSQDFIPIMYGFAFSPTLRQIFNTVSVSLNA